MENKGIMKAGSSQAPQFQSTENSCEALLSQTVLQKSGIAESKLDLNEGMALLRKNYAGELAQSWQSLTKVIKKVYEDSKNVPERAEAIHIAHKIRGTAGSIGFTQVGEIAGKLEDLMKGLDPNGPLCQVVWSEILCALSLGEELINVIVEKSIEVNASSLQFTQMPLYKLLLVGKRAQYSQYLTNLANMFSVEIEIVDSMLSARNKLKNQLRPYDVAILDLDCIGTKEGLFDLARDIRLAQGQKCTSLGVVLSARHKLDLEEMAYIGVSAVIDKNCLEEQIQAAVGKMFASIQYEKPRILVVDDDEVLTKFLTALLSNSGMIVQALRKPIKITSVAQLFNPDLVLLDIGMPGLSGYDVCCTLRATEKWQQLPILFLTAKNDQASRAFAFKVGGNDFLCKPVLAEEVLVRLRMHLKESMARRQPQRDQLTGTLNRNDFINAATSLLQRAQSEGRSFTICLLGLENFSKQSVQHGWFSMQKVLSTLGQLLNSRFKADDLRARISEDVFALAFLGENQDMVEKIISILRNEFADIKFSSDSVGHFKTIFSMGIAEYPADGSEVRTVLDTANQRLLGGKLSAIC